MAAFVILRSASSAQSRFEHLTAETILVSTETEQVHVRFDTIAEEILKWMPSN